MITPCELVDWFNSKRTLFKSNVAVFHRKILSIIISDGETPDEIRLLDETTWQEVMRQVILLSDFDFGRLSLTKSVALAFGGYISGP